MRIQASLINLADQLSSITKTNESVIKEIFEARKEFEFRDDPSVQLYGLSQAGKSTFLSCLTLGEQFIPIGTGTATTAVVVELHSSSETKAEVRWLEAVELQELVEEPLRFFLKDYEGHYKKRNGNKSRPPLKNRRLTDAPTHAIETALSSRKYRQHLGRMLIAARRARQAETHETVGKDNDLAVAEIILRHYEHYAAEYRKDFQPISNLAKLSEWTRQPMYWGDWDKRPLDSYEFSEVKSFFTKTVRLHTVAHTAMESLVVVDAPGFGISNLHDSICRSAQLGAEAVFLIVNQQIDQDSMDKLAKLFFGRKDNLFVIWNSKHDTKHNANNLLANTLSKLRNEAGIVVPGDRTAIVDLQSALRAMQWNMLQAGQLLQEQTVVGLRERFSTIYGFDPSGDQIEAVIKNELSDAVRKFTAKFGERNDKELLSDALNLSGWNEVVKLLNKAREIPQKQKQVKFAISLANASIQYLEGFPTAREIRAVERAIDALRNVAADLIKPVKKNRRAMEKKLASGLDRVFDEFLSYLTNPDEVKALKKDLAKKIKEAAHYSTVAPKLIAGVDDYVRARSAVWLKKVAAFETTESKEYILEPYQTATREIEQWIKNQWIEHEDLDDALELPSPSLPVLRLDDFCKEFAKWNKVLAEEIFTPGWIKRSLDFVKEILVDIYSSAKETGQSWWNSAKSWLYGTTKKVSPPKLQPSFNKTKAIERMEETVDLYFSKRSMKALYDLGEDPAPLFEQVSNEDHADDTPVDILFNYLENKERNFWAGHCDKLLATWYNASEQLKDCLNSALNAWINVIEPILQERLKNLNSKSPQPVPPETLMIIEQLFESSNFAEFDEGTVGSIIGHLNRLIAARRVDL